MSVIAIAVKHMLAVGMAADAIVAAIEDMESDRAPTRSRHAEAQARYREKNASRVISSDHGDQRDHIDHSKEPLSPTPPNQENPSPKKNPLTGSKRNGVSLPADWNPSEAAKARVRERGLSETQIADQVEAMRLWAESNSNRPIARKADWDKTFVVWCLRWADEKRIAAPRPTQATGRGIQAPAALIRKAVANWRTSADWPASWGPPPDHPDTLVPAEILIDGGSGSAR